jgi:hypothetical protein
MYYKVYKNKIGCTINFLAFILIIGNSLFNIFLPLMVMLLIEKID